MTALVRWRRSRSRREVPKNFLGFLVLSSAACALEARQASCCSEMRRPSLVVICCASIATSGHVNKDLLPAVGVQGFVSKWSGTRGAH